MIYLEQNLSVKVGEISNNGGLNMTRIACAMIISRRTGQLLMVQIYIYKPFPQGKGKTKLDQVRLDLI